MTAASRSDTATSSSGKDSDVDSAIEVCGVTKAFETDDTALTALQDVSLSVRHGEFVSLIGPSGCGKTTLLKILDGLVQPTSGHVQVHGRRVSGPGPERAMVFQSFALLPWRTVRENCEFGLMARGLKSHQARATVDKYLQMVGLLDFADSYPNQLSGGMQQRVGIARALAVEAPVLLMDEPFGSLDAQTRFLLQLDLERIWEADQKTVVFVTHDMDEAVFLSDRIAIMSPRPGRLHSIVDVDLPRPRTEDTRSQARFRELSSQVWDQLRTMIVRDADGGH